MPYQILTPEGWRNILPEHKGDKPHKHPHEEKTESENPANSWHLCAKNVVHEQWGEGICVPELHADPDQDGKVAWYDVVFEHGLERKVMIEKLQVTKAEDHMHKGKKEKKKIAEQVISDYSKKNMVHHITHDEDGDAGKKMPSSDHAHIKNTKPTASNIKDRDGVPHDVYHHPKGHTLINRKDPNMGHYAMRLSGHHHPQKVIKSYDKYNSGEHS
tara:strand:+ start:587 stop:1231 length:645 start_codon:yes stop_codon:yes gene_type:complete